MYKELGGELKEFALPSLYNYLYGICRILDEKYKDYSDFAKERLITYKDVKIKQALSDEHKRIIYEQLFFSYKLGNNLDMFSKLKDKQKQSLNQLALIAFYYAIYSLSKIHILIQNGSFHPQHAATYKSFAEVCNKLAFPFCMTGKRIDGSDNSNLEINNFLGKFEIDKIDKKSLTREKERDIDPISAVYNYYKGSAQWYWENFKLQEAKAELERNGFKDFRTNEARKIRDEYNKQLKPVNFLSCLYRIRGKSNYRDSLFDLYDLSDKSPFLLNEKSIKIIDLLIKIYKYYTLDIEAYLKSKTRNSEFYQKLIKDINVKTQFFDFYFPKEFQMKLLL